MLRSWTSTSPFSSTLTPSPLSSLEGRGSVDWYLPREGDSSWQATSNTSGHKPLQHGVHVVIGQALMEGQWGEECLKHLLGYWETRCGREERCSLLQVGSP